MTGPADIGPMLARLALEGPVAASERPPKRRDGGPRGDRPSDEGPAGLEGPGPVWVRVTSADGPARTMTAARYLEILEGRPGPGPHRVEACPALHLIAGEGDNGGPATTATTATTKGSNDE